MRNFSRMFREPENTPCATATEIPKSRLLNTSMTGAREESVSGSPVDRLGAARRGRGRT